MAFDRSASSKFSRRWESCVIWENPIKPLMPLMVCMARKIALTVSRSWVASRLTIRFSTLSRCSVDSATNEFSVSPSSTVIVSISPGFGPVGVSCFCSALSASGAGASSCGGCICERRASMSCCCVSPPVAPFICDSRRAKPLSSGSGPAPPICASRSSAVTVGV